MRTLQYKNFHIIQPVRLNSKGRKIAELCSLNNKLTYLTIRDTSHYFVIWKGFGLDAALVKRMLFPKNQDDILGRVEQIVIFYDGIREKRFYLSTPDDWFMKGQKYGTAKDVGDEIETYGDQYILPLDEMQLIGIDPREMIMNGRPANE